MQSGVGVEILIVVLILALLGAAFFVGRFYARPRRPGAAPPKGDGLGSRIRALVGGDATSDDDWRALEETLIRADVGPAAAREIVGKVRERREPGTDPAVLVRDEIASRFAGDPGLVLPDGLSVVMVVGVNGTGKTTTIGKLARLLQAEGRKVAVANSDTFRAAAGEQLGVWAERSGADLVAQERGADPGAVAFDAVEAAKARGHDVLIVDTAGRLHSKTPLMDELQKVRRVVEKAAGRPPDEVLLVLDATTGQNGIAQARAFTEAVGVTGIALTKMDGAARGGIAVAIRDQLELPVKVVGTGEKVEDLKPFEPAAYAASVVGE